MNKAPPILAAEDEESDAFLLQRALQQAGSPYPLIVVRDGREAVDYLAGVGPYQDRASYPVPALLLLDIKMPRMSGFDVLTWIGQQPGPKTFPIVMFSSSAHDSDMQRARELGASEYLVKPHSFEELIRTVRQLCDRWLTTP